MPRRLALALLVAAAALGVGASAAGAHAQLVRSDPAAGSVVGTSPNQVLLEFDEPVEASLGGIRVYDTDADRVDDGQVTRPGGDTTLAAPLPDLANGTYVVTYRVVSADSHPIDGAFTFQVGDATPAEDTDALVDQLLAAEGGDTAAGALYAGARTLVFLGVAGFVGTLAFALLVSPGALSAVATRRVLVGSWSILLAASAATIALQGVTAAGLPLGDVLDPSVWSAVADTRFGTLAVVRLVVLLTAGLALVLGARAWTRPGDNDGAPSSLPAWWRVLAVVTGVGVVLSVALAGHAGAGTAVPLWATVDALHLAAMATWLGGLVLLLLVVLAARPDRSDDEAVVERFSTVAFTSVVVLVLTGTAQTWRQVGSLDALTETTFGRVLLLKLFLVLVLVGVAAFSRSIVRDRRRPEVRDVRPVPAGPGAMAADRPSDQAQLRGSVLAEVLIGVLVLVASAFLVELVPARDALDEPYTAVVEADDLRLDVVVDPASTGPVDVHLYAFSPAAEPVEIQELVASLTLPAEDIGPLELPVERVGPNHFSALGVDVPIEGDWELAVTALTSESGRTEVTTDVPIG